MDRVTRLAQSQTTNRPNPQQYPSLREEKVRKEIGETD